MNDAWAADHYRQLFERQLNESYRYQALLYHAAALASRPKE